MKKIKRYTADFETEYLNIEQIEHGDRTYVWAWAICDCDTYNITVGNTIATFMQKIETLGNCEIYFHNLRYDIQFLLYYLLRTGWTQTENNKHMSAKSFSSLVSAQGIAYSLEIRTTTGNVLILDSLKKIPLKVSQIADALHLEVKKGEIDYTVHRQEGGELTPEEIDYIRRDVYIPARALNDMFFTNGFTKRTIGADCLEYYKKNQPKFFKLFPKLDEKERTFIQKAYSGGVVLCNKKKSGKLLKKNGKDFDCNSEYPYVLHSKSGYKMPIGAGIYYDGAYEYDPRHPLYIQHMLVSFKIKPGRYPFLHTSQGGLYKDTDYITDTAGEMIELVLSSYDIELLYDNYDIYNIELINGYKYEAARGYFDDYIDHFYNLKRQAKKDKNYAAYLTAKLFCNNLGGKFGQTETGSNQIFSIQGDKICSENIWTTKDTLYLPVAIFMTAAARNVLFAMINSNLDHFCYCDTDCIKIDSDAVKLPEGYKIDDYELGAWKLESQWDAAIFLRAKTYAEHTENGWKITGAGMTDTVKHNIIQQMQKDPKCFKIGAKFSGKLQQKKVAGGVVLVETDFKITKQ